MGFKKVNIVFKKGKTGYTLRLGTAEEAQQNSNSSNWRIPKASRPKAVRGFDDCVLYPPDYIDNTIDIQGSKIFATINFKTLQGKIFIKGMAGYTGDYINSWVLSGYGIPFDFNTCPEIIQEILNQLPSKDSLHDTGTGVQVQY